MSSPAEKVFSLAKKAGISELTEIQKKAIPLVESGKDCLIIAPTGFGKTEAAALPILSKIVALNDELHSRTGGPAPGILLLYITPLRALNRDLLSRLSSWCSSLGVSLAVRHGDTTQAQRKYQKENPPQFLITTPESLGALLIAPVLRDSLRNVRFVVIDEIHELIESKRGIQLSLALERLQERVNEWSEWREEGKQPSTKRKIQRVALSATIGNPALAASFVSPSCKVCQLDLRRELDVSVEAPCEKSKAVERVVFPIFDANSTARLKRLEQLILSHNKTLVFVNTRASAEALGAQLFQNPSLKDKIAVHHSSLGREARIQVEDEFKQGKNLKAIICTSSLELGIDIGEIDLVVQLVSPRQVSRWLQRLGRSGHRKHLIPKGVLLAVSALDAAECMVVAKKSKAGQLEPLEMPFNSLDVLAHQTCGLALDFPQGIAVSRAFEIISRAFPYHALSFDSFLSVVKQLSSQHTLLFKPDLQNPHNSILLKAPSTKIYYYENLSTIPDKKHFFVKDAAGKKNVGVLDESFVADFLGRGAVFISRGKPWKVLAVHEDEVVVEASSDFEAAIPDWSGEELPVPPSVAAETAGLLSSLGTGKATANDLKKHFFADSESAESVVDFAIRQSSFFLPSPSEFVIEQQPVGNGLILHSFHGHKLNESIARVLSALLTASLGESILVKSSAFCIFFEFSFPYPPEKLASLLKQLTPSNVEKILLNSLPHTPLFRHKFQQVAKRFGFISRNADYKSASLRRIIESSRNSPVFEETVSELFHEKLKLGELKSAVAKLNSGEFSVRVLAPHSEFSPLSHSFLEFAGYSELLSPPEPTAQILAAFKQALCEKSPRLFCTFCDASFQVPLSNRELSAPVFCPECGSSQVSVEDYFDLFQELKKKKRHSPVDRKRQQEMLRVASLVSAYGARALFALETFGVGPESAARVLGRLRKSDEEFFADLLEAQKTFARTRGYWKT